MSFVSEGEYVSSTPLDDSAGGGQAVQQLALDLEVVLGGELLPAGDIHLGSLR